MSQWESSQFWHWRSNRPVSMQDRWHCRTDLYPLLFRKGVSKMTYQWDELSKALADDSLPRRQSLRWLGAALAGAVLSPFGVGAAWAGKKQDPCEAFCNS